MFLCFLGLGICVPCCCWFLLVLLVLLVFPFLFFPGILDSPRHLGGEQRKTNKISKTNKNQGNTQETQTQNSNTSKNQGSCFFNGVAVLGLFFMIFVLVFAGFCWFLFGFYISYSGYHDWVLSNMVFIITNQVAGYNN